MKYVISLDKCVQIGPYDYQMERCVTIVTGATSLATLKTWAESLGASLTDIKISKHPEEDHKEDYS